MTSEPGLAIELAMWASELRVTNANEAATRLKLIDAVIFDLLGWRKADVRPEARVSEDGKTTYSDYHVTTGQHAFVIEAKRVGATFGGLPSARKSLLSDRWATKGLTADVIRQARDYGRSLSVGFSVITNGLSWVVFPVNRRDGVTHEESLAIVFENIQFTDQAELDEFRSVLSREAVIGGSLERELLGGERDQVDSRRLNRVYDRSFSKVNRVTLFPLIEREIVTAFNESLLAENADVLEKCYVQTVERTRFDSRIQMYINPREQVLKARPIRPVGRKRDSSAVKALLTETTLSQRPIALVTVGLVGAGKTTFLNYVSEVSAGSQFKVSRDRPSGCWAYVDFRDFSTMLQPREIIVDAVFKYLIRHPFLNGFETSIKHAYSSEIESLRTGPLALLVGNQRGFDEAVAGLILKDYEAKEPYVRKILSYWSDKLPVFLVIDNVDQIESVDAQSSIFLEATAFARSFRANLILAMRDITYIRNRSSAVFDAFDFDAVYIDSPDIKSVLSKRFVVAAQLLQGKTVEFDENGIRVKVSNAKLIIDMLSQSVLGTEVGRIIDIAATGDTRLALKMTRQFLQYGYSSTGKAIGIFQRTGKYMLPPHEAMRAIMLGNQAVYKDTFSAIGNPFDSYLGKSGLQFLRLYLMGVLVLYSSEAEFDGISAKEMYDNLETIGVSRSNSERVISDLISFRYVYTKSQQGLSEESVLLPSRLCGYVTRELVSRMIFLETAMFDTFISDADAWDMIETNMKVIYRERDFLEKFKRRRSVVKVFFEYCIGGTEHLVSIARDRALPLQWCSNPLKRVEIQFKSDLARAGSSAARNYGSESNPSSGLPLFKGSYQDSRT
jgi:hypothetical protein